MNLGSDELMAALELTKDNTRIAKNIILFIGDGMSIPTITASRIYKAQQNDNDFKRPEKSYLTFERLNHVALSKVGLLFKAVTSIIICASMQKICGYIADIICHHFFVNFL